MELLNPCTKADFPAYSVAYTGTAGNTTAWNPGPQGVVVWSDQACYVVNGGIGVLAVVATAPTPTSTIPFVLPVNTTGAPWRVSAVQVSTGGTIYAKPINRN